MLNNRKSIIISSLEMKLANLQNKVMIFSIQKKIIRYLVILCHHQTVDK